MKFIFVSLFSFLTLSTAHSASVELHGFCGTLKAKKDCVSASAIGKPNSVCLVKSSTTGENETFFLMPLNSSQLTRLRSMKKSQDYCVIGETFWCGVEHKDKCMTLDEVSKVQ
jgi:hypothetical protein